MQDPKHLLARLQDPKASVRHQACEELQLTPSIPAEATAALRILIDDADPAVADAARQAFALHSKAPVAGDTTPAATVSTLSSPRSNLIPIIAVLLAPVFFCNASGFLILVSQGMHAIRVYGDPYSIAFSLLWVAPALAPLVFWALLIRGWRGRWRTVVLVALTLLALVPIALLAVVFYLFLTEQIPIM